MDRFSFFFFAAAPLFLQTRNITSKHRLPSTIISSTVKHAISMYGKTMYQSLKLDNTHLHKRETNATATVYLFPLRSQAVYKTHRVFFFSLFFRVLDIGVKQWMYCARKNGALHLWIRCCEYFDNPRLAHPTIHRQFSRIQRLIQN